MRLAIQFVVRQSGWLAFSFVLFALLNAAYVCAGLWQRSGLHGYIIGRGGRGGPPHVVSVWAGFGLGWFRSDACVHRAGGCDAGYYSAQRSLEG